MDNNDINENNNKDTNDIKDSKDINDIKDSKDINDVKDNKDIKDTKRRYGYNAVEHFRLYVKKVKPEISDENLISVTKYFKKHRMDYKRHSPFAPIVTDIMNKLNLTNV